MRSAQPGLGPRGRRVAAPLALVRSAERAAWPRATQDVAQQGLAAFCVKPARAGGRVQREPIERRAERLVVRERVQLERPEAAGPLRPGGRRLTRHRGGCEVALGIALAAQVEVMAQGQASRSSLVPRRPHRPRCFSIRRTARSSTSPTSLVFRCPRPAKSAQPGLGPQARCLARATRHPERSYGGLRRRSEDVLCTAVTAPVFAPMAPARAARRT